MSEIEAAAATPVSDAIRDVVVKLRMGWLMRLDAPSGLATVNVGQETRDAIAAILSDPAYGRAGEMREALDGVLWMAEEWFRHNGSDATLADDHRRAIARARALTEGRE